MNEISLFQMGDLVPAHLFEGFIQIKGNERPKKIISRVQKGNTVLGDYQKNSSFFFETYRLTIIKPHRGWIGVSDVGKLLVNKNCFSLHKESLRFTMDFNPPKWNCHIMTL